MAALAIMAAQLIVGGWCVTPWFAGGDVVDVVAFLILGVSALAGVPGSALTMVAPRAAMWYSAGRAVLLVAVTATIVAVTDPGPGGEWALSWEVLVIAAVEIAASYALAHHTVQRRTQVYAP